MVRDHRTNINIDSETGKKLDYLHNKENRPKTWIVKRLVDQEFSRLKKIQGEHRELEVVARNV